MDEGPRDEPVNEIETDLQKIQRNLRRLHTELEGRKPLGEQEPGIDAGDPLEMNPLTPPSDDQL